MVMRMLKQKKMHLDSNLKAKIQGGANQLKQTKDCRWLQLAS